MVLNMSVSPILVFSFKTFDPIKLIASNLVYISTFFEIEYFICDCNLIEKRITVVQNKLNKRVDISPKRHAEI